MLTGATDSNVIHRLLTVSTFGCLLAGRADHAWSDCGPSAPRVGWPVLGYLDWRFIQDVATCSNGILQGKWLVDGSGVSYKGNMTYTDAWPSAEGRAIMVSGTGTIIIPLRQAYEAAGLKMPE